MIIQTSSRRLAWLARLSRLFPPGLSGVFLRCYPSEVARRENAAFLAQSSLSDVSLSFPRADHVANQFAIRGFYQFDVVVAAAAVCAPGDTIVEVGANVGTETILYARIVGPRGHVAAFEPVPGNFEILRLQLALNHLPQVRPYQAAVADKVATLRFVMGENELNAGEGRLAGGSEPAADDSVIEVQTRVLDEMLAAGELPRPRLIVMDVQGAEPFVLRGARRLIEQCQPCMVLEVEPEHLQSHGFSADDVMAFLRDAGYAAWEIGKWGLRPAAVSQTRASNWFCAPRGGALPAEALAARVSRRLFWATALPLIRGLNPAMIARSR